MSITKWLHVTGICGVATSRVAKMFQDMGWFVTGSDVQFFSPAKDYLISSKINTVEGYDYKHLTRSFWENKLLESDSVVEFGANVANSIERDSICALIFNPEKEKIVSLNWVGLNYDVNGLVMGGIDDGETKEEALKREIKEETGYVDFTIVGNLGEKIVSNYYAENKGVYRKANIHPYLVVLNSYKQIDARLEPDEKFLMEWIEPLNYINNIKNLVVSEKKDFRAFGEILKRGFVKMGKSYIPINENPDMVILSESLTVKNKEYLFAKNKNLNYSPFSKVLGDYLVKDESIVIVGTAGKTTTTSLVTSILRGLGENPSYMFGGLANGFEDSIKNTDSNYSILEGDEYHNPEINTPKFMEYRPKYVVITSLGYEHKDVFLTEESYLNSFKNLIKIIPKEGFIVSTLDVKKKLLEDKPIQSKFLSFTDDFSVSSNYYFRISNNVSTNIRSIDILDSNFNLVDTVRTSLIGFYNIENIVASVILLNNIKSIKLKTSLDKYVLNYKGVKKRLEILYENESIKIIDDFGVAPDRAKNSLQTLQKEYPGYRVIAIYEPNSSSRMGALEDVYKDVFNNVYKVIIPELSSFNDEIATHFELVDALKNIGVDSIYIDRENINFNIKKILNNNPEDKFIVIYFSSYRLTEIASNFPFFL